MIKKIYFVFLILFTSIYLPVQGGESLQIHCARELRPTLQTLRKLPEIETLVQRILKEGPLAIQYNDHLSKKFEGYWDPQNRTILITKKAHQTEANRITTMLFELHNASRTRDFQEIDYLASMDKLTKEEFIRESEYVEYENCLSTSHLLDKGIKQGLFPPKSAWWVHDNFEDHYQLMKHTGHAGWYADAYKNGSF